MRVTMATSHPPQFQVRVNAMRLEGRSKFLSRLVLVPIALALAACQSTEQQAQDHYKRGLDLLAKSDLPRASIELRQAIQLKNDLVPAMYALGTLFERQGQFDGALGQFRDVADRDAKHVDARVHAARILLAANQLDAALRYADEAFSLAEQNPEVLALKAAVAFKLGNRFDAIRFGQGVLAVDPKNVDALLVLAAERLSANDPKAALAFLDQAAPGNEGNLSLQLFRIAAFQALNDDAGIENAFGQLAAKNPTDVNVRDSFARWYLLKGRKDDAEKVLRSYSAANPKDVQAVLTLVDFIRSQRGGEAARAELQGRISAGANVFQFRQAQAQLAFAEGDYTGAIDSLNRLIAETNDGPNKATARILLARMMISRKDTAAASKLVDAVLSSDGKNTDALSIRASIRVAAAKYEEGIADLQAALSQSPLSAVLLAQLGDAYERFSKVELADEQFAKAARAEPANPAIVLAYAQFLLRYNKIDQAERLLTAFRAQVQTNALALSLLAQIKLNKRDWAGAQEVADALKKAADQGDQRAADQILATALAGQQRYDDSIKLLQASGGDVQAAPLAVLVRTYILAGKPDAAQDFLQTVLRSNPKNQTAWVLLASLHMLAKRPDDAEAAYAKAIEADPTAALGHLALGQHMIALGRMSDAEQATRKGLQQQPNDQALQLTLARLLEATSRYDEAITIYENLFAADSRGTLQANNLASLLSDYRGDPASLEKAFQIASRFRNSDVPQFQDTLGWIYYLRGDYPQALTLLKAAADKLPTIAAVQYHLGMAYKALGQKPQAIASLEKAINLAKEQGFPQLDKAEIALNQLAGRAP